MGRRTFDAIPRPLVPRNRIVFTQHLAFNALCSLPVRVRTQAGAQGSGRVLPQGLTPCGQGAGFTKTQLFCCSQEHQHNRCTAAFFGGAGKLRKLLASQNWTRVAVLGGAQIYDWFLKRNLISEMYLTLEPVIFGSGKLLASQSLKSLRRFRLSSLKRLNPRGTLLLHYKSI